MTSPPGEMVSELIYSLNYWQLSCSNAQLKGLYSELYSFLFLAGSCYMALCESKKNYTTQIKKQTVLCSNECSSYVLEISTSILLADELYLPL